MEVVICGNVIEFDIDLPFQILLNFSSVLRQGNDMNGNWRDDEEKVCVSWRVAVPLVDGILNMNQ